MYSLTKRVPALTKTVTFRWCLRDFSVMSDRFRAIRSVYRHKMDSCFWCGHAFENGETMGLAARYNAGNVVLCQVCADKALAAAGGEE